MALQDSGTASGDVNLPFQVVTLVPSLDSNKDGVLYIEEIKQSMIAMHTAALDVLKTLASQGQYSFNSSQSSTAAPGHHLAGANQTFLIERAVAGIDIDANGCVFT